MPLATFLPVHPNVLVLGQQGSGTQRGFFPTNETLAAHYAGIYVASRSQPWGAIEIYVPSKVEEDPNQGECEYTDVESTRHDEVRDRMLSSVHTNDPWHEYHAIVRNSIDWADEVLR